MTARQALVAWVSASAASVAGAPGPVGSLVSDAPHEEAARAASRQTIVRAPRERRIICVAASAWPTGSSCRCRPGRHPRDRPTGPATTRRSRRRSVRGGTGRHRNGPGRRSWSRSWSAARFRCSAARSNLPSLKYAQPRLSRYDPLSGSVCSARLIRSTDSVRAARRARRACNRGSSARDRARAPARSPAGMPLRRRCISSASRERSRART